jgi:hypothetical protein
MMDFNATASIGDRFAALIDLGLQQKNGRQERRHYLGASRLGGACERAIQYEYAQAPMDAGREPQGRLLRIFERGHRMEDAMADWLRSAGFELQTVLTLPDGTTTQFGFSDADGRLQGHIDGVIVEGPDGFAYPALWENKCLGSKSWRELHKKKLAVAKPVYAAQVALYQAYLGLHEHPAVFTAINADTMDIYVELVPFDAELAQRMSDRAVRIIVATDAGELLPRTFSEPGHFECRMCAWQDRCWRAQP